MATACLGGLPAFTSALMFCPKAFLLVECLSGMNDPCDVGFLNDSVFLAVFVIDGKIELTPDNAITRFYMGCMHFTLLVSLARTSCNDGSDSPELLLRIHNACFGLGQYKHLACHGLLFIGQYHDAVKDRS